MAVATTNLTKKAGRQAGDHNAVDNDDDNAYDTRAPATRAPAHARARAGIDCLNSVRTYMFVREYWSRKLWLTEAIASSYTPWLVPKPA